jgi:hypothetical protein
MAKYRVKPGYCLHLPNHAFTQAGEEVDLAGDLEQDVLANQGWKIEPVPPESEKVKTKEVTEPPKDRAIKEAKTK